MVQRNVHGVLSKVKLEIQRHKGRKLGLQFPQKCPTSDFLHTCIQMGKSFII